MPATAESTKHTWKACCVLAAAICVCNVARAAPPVPPELNEMLSGFSALEEGFRNNEWELAGDEIATLVTLLERARPDLRAAASIPGQRALIRSFGAKLDQLGTAVGDRDRAASQLLFVSLQEPIMELVELFDYEEHPMLVAVDEEMEERIEALDAGEFDAEEFAEEAEELEEIYAAVAGFLASRGVPAERLRKSEELVETLESAVSDRDVPAVRRTLREIIEHNSTLGGSS